MDLISFKALETEEGRREYYTYDPSNPVSMCHHAEPYLDPRFNEELLTMFGRSANGDQKLRIVWAGTLRAKSFRHMEDGTTLEYDGMRYPYMRLRTIRGYTYYKGNVKNTVTRCEQIPKNALFCEDFEYDDLGTMKFALEMKYSYAEMVQLKKYPIPGSDEEANWCIRSGKRYRVPPNPQGEYLLCHFIETSDLRYADVTQQTIDSIREIMHTAMTETEEEYIARKLKAREDLAEMEKKQEKLDYADNVDNAIIRAEKKLARGQVKIYG